MDVSGYALGSTVTLTIAKTSLAQPNYYYYYYVSLYDCLRGTQESDWSAQISFARRRELSEDDSVAPLKDVYGNAMVGEGVWVTAVPQQEVEEASDPPASVEGPMDDRAHKLAVVTPVPRDLLDVDQPRSTEDSGRSKHPGEKEKEVKVAPKHRFDSARYE